MNRLTIYLLALGVFFTATSELVVTGILQVIADDFNISIALAGQLITVYSLSFALGTPLLISLTARMGRRKVLAGSLVVFILGCLISFGSAHIAVLMISRIILGVSSGVYLVSALGTAARIVRPDKLGSAIGTIILGFSSAMILGVPMGIAITIWLSWQAIFFILALFSVLITLMISRLLPDIEGEAPIPFQQQIKVLGSMVILSGLLFTFFRESGNSILFTYLIPYIQDILHVNYSRISIIMLVFGVIGAFGSRFGGYGVDRWGATRMITWSVVMYAAILALLPLFAGTLMIGLVLLSVMVLSMFISGPAIQTYFIQQAPQSSGLVLSINTSIVHLGLAAGAGTGGVLINTTSTVFYNPWMASFIVMLGLAAAFVSFLSGKKRSVPFIEQSEKL
ncbi:MFS transporter, DHA1 family, purine base/nucleoside efflux pump [Paenibacillus sp. 1_12]|uniref:MFS transporter n=1 Tax=Paenibacillus sp. 1_12 TaxID=1566278 RepID=UPI0008EDCC27|nr:MFS transporter [Paenibacillus sp. 1_12]SFK76649.1 MFS transporter, DHA1 family, purine base/nucleoside efflux pump [Paenibacillus sp. 1_12]